MPWNEAITARRCQRYAVVEFSGGRVLQSISSTRSIPHRQRHIHTIRYTHVHTKSRFKADSSTFHHFRLGKTGPAAAAVQTASLEFLSFLFTHTNVICYLFSFTNWNRNSTFYGGWCLSCFLTGSQLFMAWRDTGSCVSVPWLNHIITI